MLITKFTLSDFHVCNFQKQTKRIFENSVLKFMDLHFYHFNINLRNKLDVPLQSFIQLVNRVCSYKCGEARPVIPSSSAHCLMYFVQKNITSPPTHKT